eukprot:SM000001S04754  [mRNA]  locus=s1:2081162:2082591:+ [translate_table: standard]
MSAGSHVKSRPCGLTPPDGPRPLSGRPQGTGRPAAAALDKEPRGRQPASASRGGQRNAIPRGLLGQLVVLPAGALLAALLLFLLTQGALPGPAAASAEAGTTIAKSSLGQRVAAILRSSGWPDEAIIFFMAMLPILELRGSIPVGYWLGLKPVTLSTLAILGNMVPVPFILLYLGRVSEYLMVRSASAQGFFDWLFEHTRRKAGPIQEFKWLGLMLFVAVPLPGTGAWSGAIAAEILGMSFWPAFWANFLGVAIAGLIVNLLCTVGLREAVLVGAALFLASTFIWSFLRFVQRASHKDEI